ncbi:hypothetical protein [Solitalea longa]|nr:hypothetical protein [Solitalea longa]
MKKLVISLTGGLFFYLSLINSSNAQVILPEVTVTGSNSYITLNEKLYKTFNHIFKEASDIKWYGVDKNFVAKFMMNEQKNQVAFTKNGTMIYHLTYGFEKNLPKDVRAQVKRRYFDYTIMSVVNLKQDNRNIWLINLHDAVNIIGLRVEDGSMDEMEKYFKQTNEAVAAYK